MTLQNDTPPGFSFYYRTACPTMYLPSCSKKILSCTKNYDSVILHFPETLGRSSLWNGHTPCPVHGSSAKGERYLLKTFPKKPGRSVPSVLRSLISYHPVLPESWHTRKPVIISSLRLLTTVVSFFISFTVLLCVPSLFNWNSVTPGSLDPPQIPALWDKP